jgi:AraC-like DNA-binding protein
MPRKQETHLEPGEFQRLEGGPVLRLREPVERFALSDAPAWQSNGGPTRGHPARSYPFSLEASIPEELGILRRIHLVGVFALFADRSTEAIGTLGASVQLLSDREVVVRLDLVNGRHYLDAHNLESQQMLLGDGTSLETLGISPIDGQDARVDVLTIDVPDGALANGFRFRDLGSPASFVVFDIYFEYESGAGCPFGSRTGGVSLSEIGAIIRVGDRVRFQKAVSTLEEALLDTSDLDEARGQALTFLAVVTAATLEVGGSRAMHREQLEAARELDRMEDIKSIVECVRARVDAISGFLFSEMSSPSGHLVDRALSIVDRNFAKDITDATLADQLGLSTSHFRFLFRQATGQPFHKYLIALRLEKARRLLLEGEMPVGEVARAVGFSGLSHFSRAFAQRFQISPTNVRRSAR